MGRKEPESRGGKDKRGRKGDPRASSLAAGQKEERKELATLAVRKDITETIALPETEIPGLREAKELARDMEKTEMMVVAKVLKESSSIEVRAMVGLACSKCGSSLSFAS